MSSYPIQSNPDQKSQVITVGNSNTPILALDDFIIQPTELWQHTCKHAKFEPESDSYYPGKRAALPKEYAIAMLKASIPFLSQEYNIPSHKKLRFRSAFFSFVATQEIKLSTPQTLPHCDSNYDLGFAVMHYLSPGTFGGTGFFRHNPTNFERVSESNAEEYMNAREAHLNKANSLPKKYFTNSNQYFKLIKAIEYKQNRLLVYPGNLLHSGLIEPDRDVHNTPDTARITANIFIDFV